MAILAGILAASLVQPTFAGYISGDLTGYAVDYWPVHVSDTAARPFGPKADRYPVSQDSIRNHTGILAAGFSRDFYGRVHVGQSIIFPGYTGGRLVNPVDIGNLLSSQTRVVEVWNGHLDDRLLSGITAVNADGLTLTAQDVRPATFGPLESRLYDLAVTTSGPPTIDADFLFAFPAETPDLGVIGRRVTIFAFRPNWDEGITERFEWLTDVLPSRDGSEQRIALREIPRRFFEYAVLPNPATDLGRLDVLLTGWQARIFAVPVWTDKGRLTSALAAGATVIPVATSGLDYHASGLALLCSDADHVEAVEIDSVTTNSLGLVRPTATSWAAGAVIAPARLARLAPSQTVTLHASRLKTASLRWEVTDPTNVAAADSATLHQGVSVWTQPLNWRDGFEAEYTHTVDRIDFETGVFAIDDPAGFSATRRSRRHTFQTRAAITVFRAWLHARQGRLAPCYVPTFENLTLIAPITAMGTALTIPAHDEALYLPGLPGRTDIAIRHTNGTWYFRRVTGLSTMDGHTVIAIDSPLGIDAQPAEIAMTCWLELCRLDADAIELAWQTDTVAETAYSTRVVKA